MSERRAIGELEDQIMAYVWVTGSPVTPAEVHGGVAPELAYTTVMTVLTRLWKKGMLSRQREGRAFAYQASEPEATHRATRMHSTMHDAHDSTAVLSSFVESLTSVEAAQLRKILAENS